MKKNWVQFCLLFKKNGESKAIFLKKHNVFKDMGEYVTYRPFLIPSEPELVSIGTNVHIAANVRLLTHDMFHLLFNNIDVKKSDGIKQHQTAKYTKGIIIGNNVAIGANAVIMYGVKVSDNTIIAAGSVVTKTFPKGKILGGNPARIIGEFDKLYNERNEE